MKAVVGILSIILTLAWRAPAAPVIPAEERAALIDLFFSTNGAGWVNRSGWLGPEETECTWSGVQCRAVDEDHATVIALYLRNNGLTGTLPASLVQLRSLQYLELSENRLTGSLPSLSFLPELQFVNLGRNQFTGGIPAIAGLIHLQYINLGNNELSGGIPSLAGLPSLETLFLGFNHLTGSIPSLSGLTSLQYLGLGYNELTGNIPSLAGLRSLVNLSVSNNRLTRMPSLAGLTNLQFVDMSDNELGGNIPSMAGLSRLDYVDLHNNQLTGSIPSLSGLSSLRIFSVYNNRLTGNVPSPSGLANLTLFNVSRNLLTGPVPVPVQLPQLQFYILATNELSGPIPSFAGIPNVQQINLRGNHLTGTLPPLNGLPHLFVLSVGANALHGNLPSSLRSPSLKIIDLSLNAFYTNDAAFAAYLDTIQTGGNWRGWQTVAPLNIAARPDVAGTIRVTWTPTGYSAPGFYEVLAAGSRQGPYKLAAKTANKTVSSVRIKGLLPGAATYFIVRTTTLPHSYNNNTVVSDESTEVVSAAALPDIAFAAFPAVIRSGQSASLAWHAEGATNVVIEPNVVTYGGALGHRPVSPPRTTTYTLRANYDAFTATAETTVTVVADSRVSVRSLAPPMLQQEGVGGATTSYVLSNTGGLATNLRLEQNGVFFSQTPSSFALAPGASQIVTVTGLPQPSGTYEGAAIPAGDGVPPGLRIPIRLLSAPPQAGVMTARPLANRIDVAAPASSSPTGSIAFQNAGDSILTGILTSDAPWLIPQSGPVTIPSGGTASATFAIDRSKRADGGSLPTSMSAKLSLSWLSADAGASVSTTVVDTIQLPVTAASPPPLAEDEIALFIPGAGHVAGSVGVFLSDVSFIHPSGQAMTDDLDVFFTPAGRTIGAAKMATRPPLEANGSITLSDVVKNIFGSNQELGSLQIRSHDAARLAVNTNILNVSNSAGTYGTAIPIFRSDRAAGPGEEIVLAGLRADSTTHTNLFLQETEGIGVRVQTEFFDAAGATLGSRIDNAGPFQLVQLNGAVLPGAVSAIMTCLESPQGGFLAFATPVDEASGDNWSVADWRRQYDYSGSEPAIIPAAGRQRGANGTFFHTDVTITNSTSEPANGTLRFVSRNGEAADRQITLGGHASIVLNDVIGTFFDIATDTVGYLVFTPANGDFALTSRTYTTVAGKSGTFGSAIPALPLSSSLRRSELRSIGAIEDAALSTVVAAVPATYRTNFGLLETSGNSTRVRVTLSFTSSDGTNDYASKDYDLAAGQFLLVPASDLFGTERPPADLRNMTLTFAVTDGDGRVLMFTSSVDNGSGDSIVRTE